MPITNKHLEEIDTQLEMIDNSAKILPPQVKESIILSAKEAELNITHNAIELYSQIRKNLSIADADLKISDKKVNAQLLKYIDVILQDIYQSQENIKHGISYQRHTTLKNNSILQLVRDIETKRITRITDTKKHLQSQSDHLNAKPFDYTKTERDDLEKFLLESVQIWNSIANIKNEDNRSKWYNKLNDNITSLTTTSKNTLYQAGNIMLSITQYGILDVVGKTLQHGVKGFSRGFINTTDKIERGLSYSRILSYSKFVTKHEEKLRNNIKKLSEKNQIKIENFQDKETKAIVKEFTSKVDTKLDDITLFELQKFKQELKEVKKQISNEYQEYKLLRDLENTLPAKLGNFAGGLVGASIGVVAAPINALFSLAITGLKNVTIDMPNLISSRYHDNKKGKKWAQSFQESFDQLRTKKQDRAQTSFINKLKTRKNATKSSIGR